MPPVRFQVSYQALSTVYSSASGLVDIRTGYTELGGGLNVGQYFDLTEAEANAISINQVVPLHAGRFRFVQVDSGATAANLLQGNYVGMVPGKTVQNVVIKTAGSGQTPGVYSVTATGGGSPSAQAVISVVVGAGGTVTGVSVTSPGAGYSSVPTFTLVTGGTVGTVGAEMAYSVNSVTSFDKVSAAGLRPGILLCPITAAQVTAGAWAFIQESGIANVNGKAALTNGAAAIGDTLVVAATGVIDDPAAGNITFALAPTVIGQAVDTPVGGALFKAQLTFPMQQG